MKRKLFIAAVLCLGATLPILTQAADEKAAGESKPAARLAGRLPQHFGNLVDKTQRDKIYAIQAKYSEKIEDLQEQLKEVMMQRDAEIREVLTAEQKKKLDEIMSAAKAKRAGKKAAVAEKSASVDKRVEVKTDGENK
jgi:Spy/CpxP family protein refolding chaperone